MNRYRIVKITDNNDVIKYVLQKRRFIFFWIYFKVTYGFALVSTSIVYYDTEKEARDRLTYIIILANADIIKSKEYLKLG